MPLSGSSAPAAELRTAEGMGGRVGRYRWVICALLFFATTINYIDPHALGILSKDLQVAFNWGEVDQDEQPLTLTVLRETRPD